MPRILRLVLPAAAALLLIQALGDDDPRPGHGPASRAPDAGPRDGVAPRIEIDLGTTELDGTRGALPQTDSAADAGMLVR